MDATKPISSLASLSGRFSSTGPLALRPSGGDPFAEIFAQMSVAAPTPTPPAAIPSKPSSSSRSNADATIDESDEEEVEAVDESDTANNADPIAAATDDLAATGAAIQDPVPVNETETFGNADIEQHEAQATKVAKKGLDDPDSTNANDIDKALQDRKTAVKQDVAPEVVQKTVVHGETDSNTVTLGDATAKPATTGDALAEGSAVAPVEGEAEKGSSKSDSNPAESEAVAEDSNEKSSAQPEDSRRVERRRYSEKESGSQNQSSANENIDNVASEARPSSSDATVSADRSAVVEATHDNVRPPTFANTPSSSVTAAASVTPVANLASTTPSPKSTISTAHAGSSSDPVAPTTSGVQAADASEKATSTRTTVQGADQYSAVQRAKLVQRVSRGFQHLGRDDGQIRLRLSPDELGSVQLDIQIRDGKLRGRMVTQTEAASGLLRDHLPELRASLQSQGIELEGFDIQHDATGQFNQGDPEGKRWQDESSRSRGVAGRLNGPDTSNTTPATVQRRPQSRTPGGVDLVA